MEQKYDRLEIKFEINDNFVDGGTERVRLEKDIDIVSEEETHLEKVIDIFYEFMQVYGFQKRSIINAMSEFIEYEKVELKEERE